MLLASSYLYKFNPANFLFSDQSQLTTNLRDRDISSHTEMKSTSFSVFFFFIVVFIAGYSNLVAGDDQCTYTIHVRTGSVDNAGTDSTISLTLGDANGGTVQIPDLASWGVNGPDYNYFERGNLDLFRGKGNCISVCSIIVTSDNSGNKPGWKLDYVDVTTEIPNIPYGIGSTFEVDQWLALDENPYSLSASVNQC